MDDFKIRDKDNNILVCNISRHMYVRLPQTSEEHELIRHKICDFIHDGRLAEASVLLQAYGIITRRRIDSESIVVVHDQRQILYAIDRHYDADEFIQLYYKGGV